RQSDQCAKVVVGDPTGAQIDAGDAAGRILRDLSARILDPLSVRGAFDLRRRRGDNPQQGAEPCEFHLMLLRVGSAESRSNTIAQVGRPPFSSCIPFSVTNVWYRFSVFKPDIDVSSGALLSV